MPDAISVPETTDINAILNAAAAEIAPASETPVSPPSEEAPEVPASPPSEEKPEVPASPPSDEKPAEKPAEPAVNVSEQAAKLRQVAEQRQQERAAKMRAEAQARQVAQENAELKARLEKLEQRAAAVEAFERDPYEYLEKYNKDPVEFLTRAHKIAMNPGASRLERELAETKARLEAVEKRPDPQETTNTALQQRTLEAAHQNVVAESENISEDGIPLYPLLSLEPPEMRVIYAQNVARRMREAGMERFSYADVCRNIEKGLANQHQQRAARLAAGQPQPKTPPAEATVQTPAPSQKPTTVSQTHVATTTGNREMTSAERDAEAERIIREQILSSLST